MHIYSRIGIYIYINTHSNSNTIRKTTSATFKHEMHHTSAIYGLMWINAAARAPYRIAQGGNGGRAW